MYPALYRMERRGDRSRVGYFGARAVADELDFHVEMRTRELVARGLGPDSARAEATRRLGVAAAMRQELTKLGKERDRTMGRTEWWGELGTDLRFGVRTLLRQPGFAAMAVLTLGLGIGATTAIFSVLNTVVLQPLPLPNPDRLVLLSEGWQAVPGAMFRLGITPISPATNTPSASSEPASARASS